MEQNKDHGDKLLYAFANAYCTMNTAGRQEAKYAATPAVEAAKQAVIDHFCGAAVRGEAIPKEMISEGFKLGEAAAAAYDYQSFLDGVKYADARRAVCDEAVAEADNDQLFGAVMNIQCDLAKNILGGAAASMAYKLGHRDARHAAADLIAASSSSARAADAPAEPSEVAMLRQALIDLHHAIQFAHDSLGGGIHKMPTMLHQPGTVTEFIENVLSAAHNLDFQPANTAWKLVPSKPTEAMLRSAISYREVAANDEIQDPVLSILDRQYRAMLAAADALDSQPSRKSVAQWLRNHYQDYPNIASLCDALEGGALDSQPTDTAMALLREVVDMRDIAETFASGAQVSDEFDALRDRIVAFLASSQPTDGGVRNG